MITDPSKALSHALHAALVDFPGTVKTEELSRRRWASITFTGTRHRVEVTLDGPMAECVAKAFGKGLGEREFDLKGHVLADIAMKGDVEAPTDSRARFILEALTVEV